MNTILMSLIMMTMTYEMPKLPYANNALEPVISQQTIDFHYGKHLQTYVNNLNSLVPGTEYEGKTVEEIVATAPDGAIFNNAGQVLNHNLYFLQFAPKPSKKEPAGKLGEAIKRDFGSFENFKKEFNAAAVGLFGSGWAWLSVGKDGLSSHDAWFCQPVLFQPQAPEAQHRKNLYEAVFHVQSQFPAQVFCLPLQQHQALREYLANPLQRKRHARGRVLPKPQKYALRFP